ncbi:MAG: RDD family protein [Nitrososphaerales archaeon]
MPPDYSGPQLELATWEDRFVAWLIDAVLVGVGVTLLVSLLAFPLFFAASLGGSSPGFGFPFFTPFAFFLPVISANSLVFLLYWTYFDHVLGQSIGKQLLNLKVVGINGNKPELSSAIIESIGKAFVIPLDVLIGLIAFGEGRQRLFSKLADTSVVRVPLSERGKGIRLTA